jgi:hypothetical protein
LEIVVASAAPEEQQKANTGKLPAVEVQVQVVALATREKRRDKGRNAKP